MEPTFDPTALLEALESSPPASWRDGKAPATVLEAVRDFAKAAEHRGKDSEELPHVVCLLHVLVDVLRGAIPLEHLAESLVTPLNVTPPLRFHGVVVRLPEPAQFACTMVQWLSFRHHCAQAYGYNRWVEPEMEELWELALDGDLETRTSTLGLGAPGGIVWVTTERELDRATPGKGIDATIAYDALGLDWSYDWTEDEFGQFSSRAVLITCRFRDRQACAGVLRVPTALDAWGHFLFWPAVGSDGQWPDGVGRTRDPIGGQLKCAEVIHLSTTVGLEVPVPVRAMGYVKRAVWDRVEECGSNTLKASLALLSDTVGSLQ